jgi:peptide/nickel transport system ATP-binding protein
MAAVLNIQGLTTCFHTRKGTVRAVDEVDLSVGRGETLGVVGESGCGKSVMALSVLRLIPSPPGEISGGAIMLHGQDLLALGRREMTRIRGNRISMIFQEPMTSLNPVYTIGFQLQEVLRKHRAMNRAQALAEALAMLDLVGIPDPAARLDAYPHQMSGGMRQRVMIAMALCCKPDVMIADEPTTALDVTIQAQILSLITRLKEEIGMAVILITHDLGVIAETAQRVAVMYAGRVVEQAAVNALFASPMHPYTVGLFTSLPRIGGQSGRLTPIPGVVPSLSDLPPGCTFQARCARVQARCRSVVPVLEEKSPEHFCRCHFPVAEAKVGSLR